MVRDLMAVATHLSDADQRELMLIVVHDPDMIRDLAKNFVRGREGIIIPGVHDAEE